MHPRSLVIQGSHVTTTLIQAIRNDRDLKTFAKVLDVVGLADALSHVGPYTVFAPREQAFEGLPPGRLDELLGHSEELVPIVRNHVVEGRFKQIDLVQKGQIRTLRGARLPVEQDGGTHVGKAKLVEHDIRCGNGILHVVDGLLAP